MKPRTIVRYEDRLKSLFEKVASIEDDELRAHWARYLCVLTCGFLEVAVPAIFSEYVSHRAAPEVANYIAKRLEKFSSPKHENLCKLCSAFNTDWEAATRGATEGEIKDHIDSLVANRHQIAHGKDTTVTIVRVNEWYKSAKWFVDHLITQCGI